MNMQTTHTRGYLDARDAARILDVSPDTVRRWAKAGRVRHVLLPSGRMRFYRADVEALLEPVETAREVDEGPFVDAPLPGLEDEAVAV